MRHTRRSPSCDYVVETRGPAFIAQILSEVKQLAYTRSNSGPKGKEEPTFTKLKNGLLNTQVYILVIFCLVRSTPTHPNLTQITSHEIEKNN